MIISLLNRRSSIQGPIFLIGFVSFWFIPDLSVIVVNCVLFLRNSIIRIGRARLSAFLHYGVKTIEIVGVGGFSTFLVITIAENSLGSFSELGGF